MSLAGIWTASLFGLSIGTIAIGTLFALMGVLGRAAFELQGSIDGRDGPKPSVIFRWLGGGLVGAPFVAILYLAVLRFFNAQSDNIVILGLLFLGFVGPKAIGWLISVVGGLITKAVPGLGPAPQPPKGPAV